jgi:hypothetical protein
MQGVMIGDKDIFVNPRFNSKEAMRADWIAP